jgi:hypothetical protein
MDCLAYVTMFNSKQPKLQSLEKAKSQKYGLPSIKRDETESGSYQIEDEVQAVCIHEPHCGTASHFSVV